METLTLTLNKAKETKNKVVYGTQDGSVIQSVSRASTKHTSGAEQKCTTREVIGQRKCPRQLFGRGVTEAGWQQAGRVSE